VDRGDFAAGGDSENKIGPLGSFRKRTKEEVSPFSKGKVKLGNLARPKRPGSLGRSGKGRWGGKKKNGYWGPKALREPGRVLAKKESNI